MNPWVWKEDEPPIGFGTSGFRLVDPRLADPACSHVHKKLGSFGAYIVLLLL
jgi:hypothetical protein